jgi:thioredoxin 1
LVYYGHKEKASGAQQISRAPQSKYRHPFPAASVSKDAHTERIHIMSVIHVNNRNFESVKASDKPVLLDFFATWCGPCRMLAPIIDELGEEHPEYVIGKVNVDEEPHLAEQFGVVSIPTLVVLRNGEVAAQSVGARPKAQILEMLEG